MMKNKTLEWICLLLLCSQVAPAQKADTEQVLVYHRTDEFAGWPANEGLWNWGNEILVGFNVTTFEERRDKHSFTGLLGNGFRGAGLEWPWAGFGDGV